MFGVVHIFVALDVVHGDLDLDILTPAVPTGRYISRGR